MRVYKKFLAESILRLILICCIFAYFPLSAMPVYTFINSLNEKVELENKDGVGGAVYTEKDFNDVVLEQVSLDEEVIEGVREPVEFSAPQMLLYTNYKMQNGDMIGTLSKNFGLSQDTLISVNGIKNSRAIQAGKLLVIPNQDGILHKVAKNETLKSIAENYEVTPASIVTANEMFSEKVKEGTNIFVPGAKLDSARLQEINGDLFIWPLNTRRITSRYGYRINPVSHISGFHSGLDIGAVTGTPIKAAMAGRVVTTGYSNVFGNYVVIAHHSNYRTLYAHMDVITAKSGSYVRTGDKIGEVGNTGQSTGSHLHFQVYKNGVTVNPLFLMN